ncbi:hypothetical protein D8B30_18510 [Verminephrobacter eiseniae]|nr:hypothetical protein [Verminephrobacter eiseniae]MCW8191663.1 hypothetical protein [Verminephrobacter eiseniae]
MVPRRPALPVPLPIACCLLPVACCLLPVACCGASDNGARCKNMPRFRLPSGARKDRFSNRDAEFSRHLPLAARQCGASGLFQGGRQARPQAPCSGSSGASLQGNRRVFAQQAAAL